MTRHRQQPGHRSAQISALALCAALAAISVSRAAGAPSVAPPTASPPATGPTVSHQGLGSSGTRQNGQQQTETMTGPTAGASGPHFQNGGLGARSEDDDSSTGNFSQANGCPGYDDSADWQEDKGSGAKQALGSTWGAITNAVGPGDNNEPERATSGVRGDAPGDDPSFGGYGAGGRSGTGSRATANLKPRGGDTGSGAPGSGASGSFTSPRVGSDASYDAHRGEKLNCSRIDHAGGARDPTRGGQSGIVPTH